MADAPIDDSRWLWKCINLVWLAFQTGMFTHGPYGFASGLRAEHTEILLPAVGLAVIMQAVGLLLFVASAIWTGKLCRAPFLCWQVFYFISYTGYAYFHWPSMAGLDLGAAWPAHIALNIWMTLHYHIEAQKKRASRTAAEASVGLFRTAKRQDCNDGISKADWILDDSSSPMTEEITSGRDWFFAYSMLFSFCAGTLQFFFAYLAGTLNTALATFGLGFTGMLIVAFVLLGLTNTSEPHRLAEHFKTANVGAIALFWAIAIVDWRQTGVCNFGYMCFVHWTACLYSGIAEILVQSPLDQELDDEGYDSERSDEIWVHVS